MGKLSKQKKNPTKRIIAPCSIRLLCESYFLKDPERLSYLRLDLLGLLLQHTAVHSGGCNIFVYEQALGIVGAAFLERLAGQGSCIFMHKGDWPQSIPCINSMKFNEEQLNAFLPLRITTFLRPEILEQEKCAKDEENGRQQEAAAKDEEGEGEEEKDEQEGEIPNKKPRLDSACPNNEKSNLIRQKRLQRAEKERRALALFKSGTPGQSEGRLDAICLAGRTLDPLEVLQKVFPGLRLAGSIVVYSPFKQHLLRVWNWLRSTGCAVNIQLHEQHFRIHQIDDNRTHPLMKQTVTGGYILSAIKVVPPQLGQQQQRKSNRALFNSYMQQSQNSNGATSTAAAAIEDI